MESIHTFLLTAQNYLAVSIEYLINVKGYIWLQLVISAITIWMTLMAGNKHPKSWLVGLANQGLWAVMIIWTKSWGLVPLCLTMCYLYYRNHLKWKTDQLLEAIRHPGFFTFDTIEMFPPKGTMGAIYVARRSGSHYIWVNDQYQLLSSEPIHDVHSR